MNKIERWFLKRLFAKHIRQGCHKENITELFTVIYTAAQAEFTEDNKPTLNHFMTECFVESMK